MSGRSKPAGRWFYVVDGRRNGPVALGQLVELILRQEIPEDTLIWRSGLDEWIKANSLADVQRQLPPPIPGVARASIDHMDALAEAQALDADAPEEAEAGEAEAEEEARGGVAAETRDGKADGDAPDGATARGAEDDETADGATHRRMHRRRRHRIRHRLASPRPGWLLPLIVAVLMVIVVLWYLLRRANEVPPGRIIQEGAASAAVTPRA